MKKTLICLLWLTLPVTILAGPAAYVPLRQLVPKSTAVFVGTVQQAVQSGSIIALGIRVDRVLKGPVTEQQEVVADWQTPIGTRLFNAPTKVTGLWFLKSDSSGNWTVLSPMTGDVSFSEFYLPVPSGPINQSYAYGVNTDPFDKVASEIEAALQATNGQSPLAQLLLAGALDSPNSVRLQQIYTGFANASAGALRVLGLYGMLKSGSVSALTIVVNDQTVSSQIAIANAVCDFRSADHASINLLGRIISDKSPPRLRACAAHALRSIHTRETVPYLAQLLNSNSSDERYEAVAGLASFANNLPVQSDANTVTLGNLQAQSKGAYTTPDTLQNYPTKQAFEQQESRYISFWTAWWLANQAMLSL